MWGDHIGRDLIACHSFISESPQTHGFLHYEAMCYTRMCMLIFQFILWVDSKQLNAFSIAKKMQKIQGFFFLLLLYDNLY